MISVAAWVKKSFIVISGNFIVFGKKMKFFILLIRFIVSDYGKRILKIMK